MSVIKRLLVCAPLFSVILFSLVSCTLFQGNTKPDKPLPPWVLNPPMDDNLTYFGVGQGYDLSRAKQVALKEISSKISISVGGTSEATSTLNDGLFRQSAMEQVKTQTQDKDLQNYKVEKTSEVGGQFYALIRIEKSGLVDSWSEKLNRLNQMMAAQVQALKQYSTLEKYIAWQAVIPQVSEAASLASLIKIVNPAFSTATYEKRYLAYYNAARETKNNLNVYVQTQAQLSPIAKEVIKQLAAQGIKTSTSKTSQTNTVIDIKGVERKHVIYESYTVELRLTLAVLDSVGKVIATNPINISGGSVISYASARISAASNLGKEFDKQGLFLMLGLAKK